MTPDQAPLSPNFRIAPAGGRLILTDLMRSRPAYVTDLSGFASRRCSTRALRKSSHRPEQGCGGNLLIHAHSHVISPLARDESEMKVF
ncbi:hypothetical protein AVEN_191493-1 [Araneus ventricosus]|uniref:Uncharacterized protein n=1 Tax=Araneus ventricosus TaxID=182803 RepID=A0A4Y2RZK1_ARAVE|nr:hypothetical protein AVEN_191493-1 [Araneus ventricosus]